MGIRNAGTIIKEARLRAGLIQEQMSFGICSLVSLCNIENGKLGVSSSTFQALMKRAGEPSAAYPLFKNRKDFDAYMLLKNVRLYTEKNCLLLAYDELFKLKQSNYGGNKLYYQEALYFYARIKYLTYDSDYSELLDVLASALDLTQPDFNPDDFENTFLSSVECEIIFLMAHIYINTERFDDAEKLIKGLQKIIDNSLVDDTYTAYIKALWHFTSSKFFFCNKEYAKAKEQSDIASAIAYEHYIEPFKLEIVILKAINDFCVDNSNVGNDLLYLLSLASHLECNYVPILKGMLRSLNVPAHLLDVEDPGKIELTPFSMEADLWRLSDGTIDPDDENAITLGSLIGALRFEQRVPMSVLCDGLCSVSKLSKIENKKQAPSIYLAEALLNRLGYSERDFVFYGDTSESDYWKHKNFLIAKQLQGAITSKEVTDIIDAGIKSDEPAIKQLCLSFLNNPNYTSYERDKALLDSIKISIPDFDIKTLHQKRLSWIEISILNGMCKNSIKAKRFDEAKEINDVLCAYADQSFITPRYKSNSLLLSFRIRFKYLYNLDQFDTIIEEFSRIKDEFMLKSSGSAADFFFYTSQAYGELHKNHEMILHTRIAAGYFMLMGLYTRRDYLLSEIKRQFNVEV